MTLLHKKTDYSCFLILIDTKFPFALGTPRSEIDDKDYHFALNINNDLDKDLCVIDIYPKDNGSYTIEKYGVSIFVSELQEIEKLLSIFYGSVFSLKFERVFVKWVRYEVTIPSLKVANLSELKETIRTLKYLLEKVDIQVNLD